MNVRKLTIYLRDNLPEKERAWLMDLHKTYEDNACMTVMRESVHSWTIALWPDAVTRLTGGEDHNEQWLQAVLGYNEEQATRFVMLNGDLFLVILKNNVGFVYAVCISADLNTIHLVGEEEGE